MSTNAFHDFELTGWEKAAAEYDRRFGELTSQSIGPLLDAAGAAPGTRLLDVACGPGHVAAAAARRGATVIGVDFSTAMVDRATEQYSNLEFHVGDAEALDFSKESFDAVVMNFGMLHLARPDTAIAEAFRVLRPGGRYAFTVWDEPHRAVAFGIILDSVQLHGSMDVTLPPGPPFFRFSQPEESMRAVAAAGFMHPQTLQIPQVWKIESGDELLKTFQTAAVRTAALLRAQTPEAMKKIREVIAERVKKFLHEGLLELPMPSILTSAIRPAGL